MRKLAAPAALAIALVLASGVAEAAEPSGERPLRFEDLSYRAGEVEADPQLRELTLRRSVVVKYGRYRIESDALHLTLSPRGILVEGDGRVAFCPCAEPPVAIAFSGGRVAPPGELIVTFPRLELFGVPVFALPWLWIRAQDRPGLLPPTVAWRGDDGLFAGAGAHLPWRGRDGAMRFIDLTAGGYFEGGAEVGVRAETPTSTTHALVDYIRSDRVVVESHGWQSGPVGDEARLAWDVDAIRGPRGRSGTIDLVPAAQPFDTAAVEASARAGPALLATGVRASAFRSEGRVLAGPDADVSVGGALGRAGSWEFATTGFVLGNDVEAGATPVAVALAGAELSARPGPLEVTIGTQERARVAGRGAARNDPSESADAVASARCEVRLPFARVFGEPSARAGQTGDARLVHWVAPVAETRLAAGISRGTFFLPQRTAIAPLTWTADGGVTSSIGRYGGAAGRVDLRGGFLRREPEGERGSNEAGAPIRSLRPLAHARLGATTAPLGAGVEVAAVGSSRSGDDPFERPGLAAVGHTRIGPDQGVHVGVEIAAQAGEDARDARAIADGVVAALPGEELAYLEGDGTTGAASVFLPWTRALSTSARVDADLIAPELVGVRGDLGYHHPCGCLKLDLVGAHRVGRGGVDVWLAVDLAPSR